ncbi:DUF6111 family protein [Rhodoblastus acidophilus]|jgi:Family of unknown function (DUF6111)|uniref:DUF6111 family protein n=1 Tax=Candidatus Rhodoblastus alkanivorans TaxID=2954117 RepID=A0ABS9Z4M7_9HYPH|nr:DUF6111 family protein [Candidatus Rhodoblastus alkanivorans]MCI4677639.1 DUF6111 family protein [Candidatus Rhodoblastus alkanivorans]MCI4682629.1 DUF6111 family protein [Candidatus Rhodoblastus alkanivorans]MDI4639935.1 DUF6111 family protein [Rhodoblastus acidophilus]
MARSLFESLGLFAAPFLVYALFLVLRARHPLLVAHWSRGRLFWLTLSGFALVIAGFLYAGFAGSNRSGVYVPAHIEHGRLTPGRFE